MNLTKNPTEDEMRSLLASVDDSAAPHILWVDEGGNVHITDAAGELVEDSHPGQVRFRSEILSQGNGYVGESAAGDASYVSETLQWLIKHWNESSRGMVDTR